jgi:hypothetical protein
MKSVQFPFTLTEIGVKAFGECVSLQSVDIPLSVTLISSQAFIGCKSLVKASYWYGTTLGSHVFDESGFNQTGGTAVTIHGLHYIIHLECILFKNEND